MQINNRDESLEALKDIRSIMDRSARFISLSGWSGIWAGCTALVGAAIAASWLQGDRYVHTGLRAQPSGAYFDSFTMRFIFLAAAVAATAFAGGFYFTYRKAKRQGHTLWNKASRLMLLHLFFPLFAGGIFTLVFIYYGFGELIAPACLVFYGLALIGASGYTLSEIRYLGMLNVALGCACLFFPGYGLFFWSMGFGILHILYGAIMWNKYDK